MAKGKTLLISDTHLGRKFDLAKLVYLTKIIKEADNVIILGDFWEGYEFDFTEFLKSEWRALFPELKRKRTVYITGNHDLDKWVDRGKAKVFCDQVVSEYKISIGNQDALLMHGHVISPSNELQFKFLAKRVILRLGNLAERTMVNLFGQTFLRIYFGGWNKKQMKWQEENLAPEDILVCGHSHYQFQQDNFYNLGFCKHGYAQYGWLEDGKITLVDDKYKK